jgi:hypothetical protein
MRQTIQNIKSILEQGEDLLVDLANEISDFWNANRAKLNAEEIGMKMNNELCDLGLRTADGGKSFARLIADSMALHMPMLDRKDISDFLKGTGFVGGKSSAVEGANRSRMVKSAMQLAGRLAKTKTKTKTKTKSKSKGSRPAINADMIVAWINEGNLTSKKDGQAIATAIAKCFNS